jgi:hypothetical protein
MPSLVVPLDDEEFGRLRERALDELRHPRHTARLLLREALALPPRAERNRKPSPPRSVGVRHRNETERVPA